MTNETAGIRHDVSLAVDGGNERQLVVFSLADESFGVNIDSVREIIRWQPVTHVPDTSASVLGALNLRGTVIPVVDLRHRFGMPTTEATDSTRILVVDIGVDVGALVDSVTEVIRLSSDAIGELSPVVASANSEYIEGIAKTGDRLLILLNMDRALAEPSAGVGDGQAATQLVELVSEPEELLSA